MHIVGLYCTIDTPSRVWSCYTVPAGCMELQYFNSLDACNSELCNVSTYVRTFRHSVNRSLLYVHWRVRNTPPRGPFLSQVNVNNLPHIIYLRCLL